MLCCCGAKGIYDRQITCNLPAAEFRQRAVAAEKLCMMFITIKSSFTAKELFVILISFCKCGTACRACHCVDGNNAGFTSGHFVVNTFLCCTGNFQRIIWCGCAHNILVAFWCIGHTACFVCCTCAGAVHSDIWFTTHIAFVMCT